MTLLVPFISLSPFMANPKLKVTKRKILGRKIKKLRKEGILPANIYGKKIKSLAVQLPEKEFLVVYKEAGETSIVDLNVGSEKESRPVLIANLQTDHVTDAPLHVDFRQVVLTEKTTATIPVELAGEAPAVDQKKGILVQQVDELDVEALPKDLPDKLVISISGLDEVGDTVYVKDIKVDEKKIEIKADASRIIAKIEPPTKEEEIEKPPEEEVSVEEEVPAEEKPAEEKKPEEGKPKEKPAKEEKSEKTEKKK